MRMMSQESQPRASSSSPDIGRKGAGVSLLAQKGLYEKMSGGSRGGGREDSVDGDGTLLRLPDSGGKVNGILGGGGRNWTPGPTFLSDSPLVPRGSSRHGTCISMPCWPRLAGVKARGEA